LTAFVAALTRAWDEGSPVGCQSIEQRRKFAVVEAAEPHINDAEMHLHRAAEAEGATINALGATRDVCAFCQQRLPANIPIATPLKK
jgi:hypothetical protein